MDSHLDQQDQADFLRKIGLNATNLTNPSALSTKSKGPASSLNNTQTSLSKALKDFSVQQKAKHQKRVMALKFSEPPTMNQTTDNFGVKRN
jgi:hypothetical protein